jgi:hypothetical protein
VTRLAAIAALAFAAWALWQSGHHVWSVVVPILGVATLEVKTEAKT